MGRENGLRFYGKEQKRKKLLNDCMLLFMILATIRLFVCVTFFQIPEILSTLLTFFTAGVVAVEVLLALPDMNKNLQGLWKFLLLSLGISYLVHFTGLEYICNTIILLGTLTVLPQTKMKREWTEGFLLAFTFYVFLLSLFADRTLEDENAFIYLNPNGIAFVFVLNQFVLVSYARTLGIWRKIVIYIIAVASVFIQIQFGGRSSLIGTGALVVYCVLQKWFDGFSRRRIKWLSIILCIGSILFTYFYAIVLYGWLGDDTFFLGKDIFSGREVIWTDAFEQIKGHWFFGIGNTLGSISVNGDTGATNIHNQMLGYFVCFGLFAMIAYMLLYSVLAARLCKGKRKTATAFAIILIVMSYFDTILYSTANMVYLPIALTIVFNFDNEKEKKTEMVIHYCWVGGNEKSEKIKCCIESWKRVCPDAKIVEWNESNYDVNKNAYIKQAYEQKKYAFVADYMRFDILYRQGGVYFDTDVELLKDITPLLGESFMGFERAGEVAPGLVMNAMGGEELLKEVLDYYDAQETFTMDKTVVDIMTEILLHHGLEPNNNKQTVAGFTIYPSEYFNPKGGDYGKEEITENTYSVHHYLATWKSPLDQLIMQYKVKYGVKKGKILFTLRHPILAFRKMKENR